MVRDYFEENFYEVENTELRPPTVQEVSSIQSFGQDPPDLVWAMEITLEPVGITYEELERASEASVEWGVKIYGEPLEFEHEWERTQWFIDLENLDDWLDNILYFPYFGENGTIVGRGYGVDGYYEVTFRYDAPPTENMMEEVFVTVNEAAEMVGFDHEVPVKFTLGSPGFFPRSAVILLNAYTGEVLHPITFLV